MYINFILKVNIFITQNNNLINKIKINDSLKIIKFNIFKNWEFEGDFMKKQKEKKKEFNTLWEGWGRGLWPEEEGFRVCIEGRTYLSHQIYVFELNLSVLVDSL